MVLQSSVKTVTLAEVNHLVPVDIAMGNLPSSESVKKYQKYMV